MRIFVVMIGAVSLVTALSAGPHAVFRSLGAAPLRAARPHVVRAFALGLTAIVLLNAGLDGAGAAPSLASTSSLRIVGAGSREGATQPRQVGGYISGTVWDDTAIRNGSFDDNETGIPGVTLTVERVDVPGSVTTCTSASPPNVNPTGTDGRYRCAALPAGRYRVSITTLPPEFEATTPRQREVTVTATEGGVANFGLARLDRRIRSIGGVVFLDCNENGVQDQRVEFDERPDSGYEVTLERVDGSNSNGATGQTSTRQNRFTFDNLQTGTYVVALRISSSRYRATTATRREITIGSTFGAVVDFGIVDTRGESDCTEAAEATATIAARATGTAAVRSGQIQPGQPADERRRNATATAAASTATATAATATAVATRFTPTPTPTPPATATAIPSQRLDAAYPRAARFMMQAVVNPRGPNRIDMLAEGALIGTEVEVVTSDGRRVGTEQLSMRIRRNDRVDDIVVTATQAYRQSEGDEFWREVTYEEIRNELGLLVPFDAITALRCVTRATENGQTVVDDAVATLFYADVDALRLWETSVRPRYGGGGGGGGSTGGPAGPVGPNGQGAGNQLGIGGLTAGNQAAFGALSPGNQSGNQPGTQPGGQPGSQPGAQAGSQPGGGLVSGGQSSTSLVGGTLPRGGTRPVCTPPAAVEPQPGQGAAYVYQTVQLQAWIGTEDGKIRAERFTSRILPPISDPKQIPDPLEFEAVLTFWDVNLPMTILPPAVPTPTPLPTMPPAPVAAPGTASGTAPGNGSVVPPPGNGQPGQAPTPGLSPDFLTPAPLPPEGLPPEGPPPDVEEGAPPVGEPPTQREQVLAAERALVALATGGQPRTGSVARGNQIQLDVPWRSQLDNTAYAGTNSGPASLASSLGAYGIDVAVPDLRALMNGLDSNYSPGSQPRVETIARVAERGGLNVLDLYRGPRFNEWTVEQVRESLRRGYPVVTLVQGAVLPGGTPPGAARERFVTIIGMDGEELIYHDPAYPDEGAGAARRITPRTLEQAWLAASTPRLGMALAQGPDARGLLDVARGQPEPGQLVGTPSPSPDLTATVPVVATIAPPAPPAAPDNPWGLPVHPVLIVFWVVLVLLLLAILLRSLR